MRLITLNVALFEKNNDKLFRFLSMQNADIICLQEVTVKVDKTTDPEFISKDTIDNVASNLVFSSFAPAWVIKDFRMKNFHKQAVFYFDFKGFLEFGSYVKSKFKILKTSTVFVQENLKTITNWDNFMNNDPRLVQVIDLELPEAKKLRILNYHGIWTQDKQGNRNTLDACVKIKELALEVAYPVIITGDFNLFPDTESMKILNESFISLVDKYGISTTRPDSNELSNLKRNVVDYIFITDQINVNSFNVLNVDVSDHFPLVLDFDL